MHLRGGVGREIEHNAEESPGEQAPEPGLEEWREGANHLRQRETSGAPGNGDSQCAGGGGGERVPEPGLILCAVQGNTVRQVSGRLTG